MLITAKAQMLPIIAIMSMIAPISNILSIIILQLSAPPLLAGLSVLGHPAILDGNLTLGQVGLNPTIVLNEFVQTIVELIAP